MFTIGGTSNRGFYSFEPTGSLRFEDGDSPYLRAHRHRLAIAKHTLLAFGLKWATEVFGNILWPLEPATMVGRGRGLLLTAVTKYIFK